MLSAVSFKFSALPHQGSYMMSSQDTHYFYRLGSWWGTPRNFILLECSPYTYSSVGYYSKFGSILSLEKMTSFSQSEKDVEMATVTSCCLIPLWIKCDRRLVDLMFPGQRALGAVGDCPGRTYLWLTAIFPSTSPPNKPYPCAPTPSDSPRPDPSSLLSQHFLPTFLRLSIDMFFSEFFSCSFSTFPLPLLSGILKRNEDSFFLRVESLGSPSLLNREKKLAL